MEMTNSVRQDRSGPVAVRAADFSAPLAAVTAGRMEFHGGTSRTTIGGASMDELFRAHFEGPEPEVVVDGGTVVIRSVPRSDFAWAWFAWLVEDRDADIALNTSVPWELVVRGGVSRLDADLSRIRLTGIEIRGGASNVELDLSEPAGVVPIRVRGGASHVSIRRPAGVPVAASVQGGISRLTLDDQRFGALGGRSRVTTGPWGQATSSYDIEIAGGASHLTVEPR
jgi:hypothetical protein